MKVEIDHRDLEILVKSTEMVLHALEEDIRERGHEPANDSRYIDLGVSLERGRQALREIRVNPKPT